MPSETYFGHLLLDVKQPPRGNTLKVYSCFSTAGHRYHSIKAKKEKKEKSEHICHIGGSEEYPLVVKNMKYGEKKEKFREFPYRGPSYIDRSMTHVEYDGIQSD